MKIYITVNGKAISFATTFVLIFALLIFIAMTNLYLTYAVTKDSGFNSNTTTTVSGLLVTFLHQQPQQPQLKMTK